MQIRDMDHQVIAGVIIHISNFHHRSRMKVSVGWLGNCKSLKSSGCILLIKYLNILPVGKHNIISSVPVHVRNSYSFIGFRHWKGDDRIQCSGGILVKDSVKRGWRFNSYNNIIFPVLIKISDVNRANIFKITCVRISHGRIQRAVCILQIYQNRMIIDT
ncbi:hypothetical protein FGO68_gene9124 [Halteria grandinella]|uniref:Uncharacterized protein n=1 Tax=Halteria grandinella TaxID=5974 RepID=A0A8J8SUZ7_HALGN|nr:hypothetical protein FGO68_gene9124 [Halteria grandinella]